MLLSTVSTEDLIGDYRPITLFLLLFISYLVTVLYVWITLRVGLVLPASAIGNRLKLHEAFNFTRPVGGDLIVTAALIAGVYHIPDIFEFVSPSEPTQSENQAVIAFLSDLIFNWISLFLGFGILTILYGHLCEEKSI